ncbi:hypothetical protein GQ55_9G613900 [Panicum hallii var. hallii]|uniref:Uncharacterized protein n=1 Tax=Panicum hallii var. hallii TaxID=1504633 RepID=A0A2T7CHR0_9POAL|nr:hypothetical protein GQ55_9G613900 [Panicum hallii var. hallii]
MPRRFHRLISPPAGRHGEYGRPVPEPRRRRPSPRRQPPPPPQLTPRRESCDPHLTGARPTRRALDHPPAAPLPAPHAAAGYNVRRARRSAPLPSPRTPRGPERAVAGRGRLAPGAPPSRDKRKPLNPVPPVVRRPRPRSPTFPIPRLDPIRRPPRPRAHAPFLPFPHARSALRPGRALPPNPKVAFRAAR